MYDHHREYSTALEMCEEVLNLDPQNQKAIFVTAESYCGIGNVDKCQEYLEKCRSELAEDEKCNIGLIQLKI